MLHNIIFKQDLYQIVTNLTSQYNELTKSIEELKKDSKRRGRRVHKYSISLHIMYFI